MSQVGEAQSTQSEGLRLRTFVQQNSEGVKSITEDGDPVREEANSLISQPNSRVKAFPRFMIAISLIQVCAFYMGGDISWLYLGYDPSRRHEVWRFITKMFVHSSGSHLWGNVIVQLIFGVPLEIHHHWKRTAIIYTGGVLGGTLFGSFFTPNECSLGASAGVYALTFAQVAANLLNWNDMDNKLCRIFLPIVAYMIYHDVQSVYNELDVENEFEINDVGHFGGAVTGFLISIIVLKISVERPWKKTLRKICAVILITLTLIIVLTNFAFPCLYPQSEFNTDYKGTALVWYFKLIDKSSKPSDHLMLIKCLKLKKCADAWAEYKNTGRVTDVHFLDEVIGKF